MMKASVVDQSMANLTKSQSDHAAKLFVWGTLLVMMIANFYILADAGRVFPLYEDWWLVPPLTGNEPNLAACFWIQNSEH